MHLGSKTTDVEKIIDDLIGRVKERYPKQRIQKIKDRTNAVWFGRPPQDRLVYISCENFERTRDLPEIPAAATPSQRELIEQLQTIINHSDWDDDFFPAIASGLRQVTIPSYFGCVEESAGNANHVKPIIREAANVYQLPEIGFIPGTVGGDILEKMRYFHQRTHGQIPVFMTDMQGPFSVAAQMWGIEDFLMATYDRPKEVHFLLQKCTDIIINYYRLMREAVEGNWVPMHCHPLLWMPEEKGVAVSDDFAAIVSPDIIRCFTRPYMEQIAAVFGGVVVHSCGSINHAIGELCQIKGLVGLNFSSTETDFKKVAEEVDPDKVLIVHNTAVHRDDLPLLDPVQQIELCKKVFAKGRAHGICIVFGGNAKPEPRRDRETWKKSAIYGKQE
jgi:hypothetical protein